MKKETDTELLARLMAEGFGQMNTRFDGVDARFDGMLLVARRDRTPKRVYTVGPTGGNFREIKPLERSAILSVLLD